MNQKITRQNSKYTAPRGAKYVDKHHLPREEFRCLRCGQLFADKYSLKTHTLFCIAPGMPRKVSDWRIKPQHAVD